MGGLVPHDRRGPTRQTDGNRSGRQRVNTWYSPIAKTLRSSRTWIWQRKCWAICHRHVRLWVEKAKAGYQLYSSYTLVQNLLEVTDIHNGRDIFPYLKKWGRNRANPLKIFAFVKDAIFRLRDFLKLGCQSYASGAETTIEGKLVFARKPPRSHKPCKKKRLSNKKVHSPVKVFNSSKIFFSGLETHSPLRRSSAVFNLLSIAGHYNR